MEDSQNTAAGGPPGAKLGAKKGPDSQSIKR